MKQINRALSRALTTMLAAALLLSCLPASAMAVSLSAKVKSKVMYVSKDAEGKDVAGKLGKGTKVAVTGYKDGVARIQYRGRTGYAKASDLKLVKSAARKSAKKSAKKATKKVSKKTSAKKAVAKCNTLVFEEADVESDSVKVKAGTSMYVLAVKGDIAMVRRGGAVGYAYRKHLIVEGQSVSGNKVSRKKLEELKKKLEKQKKKEPTLKEIFQSGKYSNEKLCYLFLTKVVGYNTAAAAGVLANINYESGFKIATLGDGGSSYGICQWHASRRTRLKNYCADHDLDADSLLGQLMFLKYELENYYPKVHHYLQDVENSASGAYNAGYYFCYNYEAPAARTSQSSKRASSAKSTYYPRYA